MPIKRIYRKAIKASIETCKREQIFTISAQEFLLIAHHIIYKNSSWRKRFPIVTKGKSMLHSVVLDPVLLTSALNSVLPAFAYPGSSDQIQIEPKSRGIMKIISMKMGMNKNNNLWFTLEKVESLLNQVDTLESEFQAKYD